MFAVIYQAYIKPEKEEEYQKLWHQIAAYFVEKRGALGSTLHKMENGMWLAYSRWPDKKTRDASWSSDDNAGKEGIPLEIKHASEQLKNCIDRERDFMEIPLTVVDDLLLKKV